MSDPEQKKEVQVVHEHETVFRSGPLPDSSELKKYEDIKPGFAERIMRMAEREQAHRHKADLYPIWRPQLTINIGQLLAFIIALVLISCGVYLAINDKDLLGFGSILMGIAPLVAAFIYDRTRKEK